MILKYYGLDWLATVLTLTAIYFIGEKKQIGFIYGMLSNILWIVFGAWFESAAIIVANVGFLMLNMRGYWFWMRENRIKKNSF